MAIRLTDPPTPTPLRIEQYVARPSVYVKVWGSIRNRFFLGNVSAAPFPVEFSSAPSTESVHDATVDGSVLGTRAVLSTIGNYTVSAGSYMRYAVELSGADLAVDIPIGTRTLLEFEIASMPAGTYAALGLFRTATHDAFSGDDQLHFEVRSLDGQLQYRMVFGDGVAPWATAGEPYTDLRGRRLLLELERTGSTEAVGRVFDIARSIDTPLWSSTATKSGGGAARAQYFGIGTSTLVTWDTAPAGDFATLLLYFIDVEPGSGFVLDDPDPVAGTIEAPTKGRLYRDDFPLTLTIGDGLKTISARLLNAAFNETQSTSYEVTLDRTEPTVMLRYVLPETRVLTEGQLIQVGGGARLRLVFSCDRAGSYSIRHGATSILDGTELAAGDYPTADQNADVTIDTSAFPEGQNRLSIFFTGLNGLTNAVTTIDPVALALPPTVQTSLRLLVAGSAETALRLAVAETRSAEVGLLVNVAVRIGGVLWRGAYFATPMRVLVAQPGSLSTVLRVSIRA